MKSTNVWDAVAIFLSLIYLLFSFAGAAYLITAFDWSPWWMFFPAFCMAVRVRTGVKLE